MVAESAKEGFAPTVSGVTVGLQSLGYISHANQLAWTCFKSSKQLVELGILLWLLSEWRHHSRPKKKTQSASSPYPSECLRPSKKKKIFSKTRQTFIAAETPSTIFSPRQIKNGPSRLYNRWQTAVLSRCRHSYLHADGYLPRSPYRIHQVILRGWGPGNASPL